ncbi:unnamed protein product [Chondrus crispus]|uniref:Gal-2,6-Sulfurylases II n=1 Tax=Chondrus crispus TaxID=2769 RepID=R7Q2Y4_CHOCR|nr:unnamed protein product [Chondrus crispus]CDF32258.1 unnamed protein product [Chondrus crispus]|eukprot:XP_005711923.1 unnamed protein product [Chondrus crispus]
MNLKNLFIAALLCTVATVNARPRPCGSFCKFRLCNFDGDRTTLPKASFTILGAPSTAQLPFICRPGQKVGEVLKTGEAQVFDSGRYVPISEWSPRGLRRNFISTYIRPFKVPALPHSGLGRLSSSVNQHSFLHDQCMIIPVNRYEIINYATGRPTRILNASGRTECVAFRTTAPTIEVKLTWDSQDDFDLEVEEPDGDVLSFRNTRTEYGKLNGDNNAGRCDSDSDLFFGRENVVYFPNPNIETGRYKVRVIHYNKCSRRPTNWKLMVVINGAVKVKQSKFSAVEGPETVGTAAFNF